MATSRNYVRCFTHTLITPVLKLTTISWMEILGVDTDRDSLEKTLLGDSMLASERENKKHLHRHEAIS